jgi:hypothetical protein
MQRSVYAWLLCFLLGINAFLHVVRLYMVSNSWAQSEFFMFVVGGVISKQIHECQASRFEEKFRSIVGVFGIELIIPSCLSGLLAILPYISS